MGWRSWRKAVSTRAAPGYDRRTSPTVGLMPSAAHRPQAVSRFGGNLAAEGCAELLVGDRKLESPYCVWAERGRASAVVPKQAGLTRPQAASRFCF